LSAPTRDDRRDHYAVLGVGPTVAAAEIRRAYRLLALRHHPDRAGPGATATFQRIAEAYRVLSNPTARSSYDAGLREAEEPRPREHGARSSRGPSRASARAWAPTDETLIIRLSGPLDALVDRDVARVRPDGMIELYLSRAEARSGGTAAIQLPLGVPCPTCGGVAARNRVWCRRCEFEGMIVEDVTLCVPIPPFVSDGATFRLNADGPSATPPLAVRIRV
jgi:DnaJ-class molecular chaperone